MIRSTLLAVALLAGASMIGSAWAGGAIAAPRQLDCVLTDTEAQPGSESRPVAVTFDDENKTLTAEEGGRHYVFGKVMISSVTINGRTDNVSLGIDRSSLGIVWQQYEAGKVRTEYGHCRPARAPS